MTTARVEPAPAKVNLTLRVLGRRRDGYHEIESLVVFASLGDALAFVPGRNLALAVRGPTAASAGEIDDNLVLRAVRALAERIPGLRLGRCSAIPPNDPDFGQTEVEIVQHWCRASGIPYLGRADIGHDAANKVVPFGAR